MFFSCFCLHESLYFSRCCPVVELLTGSVVFEIPNRPCVLWRANSFRGGSENSGVSGSKCHSDLQPRCRPSPVTCCCLEALKLLPTPWGFASFSSNPFGKKRPRDQVIFLPVTLTAPQITAVFFSYDAFVLTCFNPRHVMILVDFVMIFSYFLPGAEIFCCPEVICWIWRSSNDQDARSWPWPKSDNGELTNHNFGPLSNKEWCF